MKKFLLFLIIIFIPCIVLADAGGPSIIGYDAVVTNKNGAKADGENITVKYNTKIYVQDEYDDTVYACYPDGKGGCDYERDTFVLKRKDISPIKSEVSPSDIKISDDGDTRLKKETRKIFVSSKKGIKLKKGPAEIYGEYSETIPYKEIIESSYAIISYRDKNWYYIDNGQYKGWIKEGVAPHYDSSLLTFKEVKLYNIDTDTIVVTIPYETKLDDYYYNDGIAYVNYQDYFGYLKDEDGQYGFEHDESSKILVLRSTEIKSNTKALTGVPKGEEIRILYADYESYYVEYSNVRGFINNNDVVEYYAEENNTETYDKDLEIYDVSFSRGDGLDKEGASFEEYCKKHKTGKTVPAYTTVSFYGGDTLFENNGNSYYINLIKYGNTVGWVIKEAYENNYYHNNNNNEDVIIVPEEEDNNKTVTIIIYSLIGAALLSLTAVVIIKLINNKKKKVVEPKKEEVKENNNKKNEG